MFEIRVPNNKDATQRLSLEGNTYFFRTYFNSRKQGWTFDLTDSEGNEIVMGVAIAPNQNLTYRYEIGNPLEGDFVCLRLSNTEQPIGRSNLGFNKDYTILFMTPEELDLFKIER